MQLLCPEEVETLICGFPGCDVDGLRRVMKYDGYKDNDTTIQ